MAILDLRQQAQTPHTFNFEETYKMAYSHGLEAIYALENVDSKSIRPIPRHAQSPIEKPTTLRPFSECPQLELDLGEEYRGWMESFLNYEPIQVLSLSRHAEKCLLDHGKKTLRDLIGVNLRDFLFFKGMGQGHLDEIQQKLYSYINGRPLHHCKTVDFASWVRSLTASLDRKTVFLGLQPYQLSDLVSLSLAEKVEIGRLTLENKAEWRQEAMRQFRFYDISASMETVVNVHVKGWVRGRAGIANASELTERLQRISNDPAIALSALQFFSDVYCNGQFPLSNFLYRVDDSLYCADPHTASLYQRLIEKTVSYFYKPEIGYTLSQLVSWLEREFAREWQGFPEGFVEKALRYSPRFRVRKDLRGIPIVKMT